MDLREKAKQEKNYINTHFKMSEVLYKLTGIQVDKYGNCDCPIHGKAKHRKTNASVNIHKGDNKITCWSERCLYGSGTFHFLDKYYREVEGLNDWKEIYKRIDDLLGTHLFIPVEVEKPLTTHSSAYTHDFKVNKYCDEVRTSVRDILSKDKVIVVNAGTGVGKTTMLTRLGNQLLSEVDYVFFLTARRSIVEEIASKNDNGVQYNGFMGDDWMFGDDNKLIVATTHKARAINRTLAFSEMFVEDGEIKMKEFDYAVIVDECHLLHASRNIVGDMHQLDELISKSKFTVFTSANTKHFYNASKETYGINAYINIERKERIYNLDSLEMIRLDSNVGGKMQYLVDTISKEGNKVLYINNDIKFNQELVNNLKLSGIDAIEINAKNKDSEAYENIIKKSLLSTKVTICTSVIDTGVNILTDNVTTIISVDANTFDDISIIQGFARVRTTNNNKGILILECKKDFATTKKVTDIKEYEKYYDDAIHNACMLFNIHMLDNYDADSYEEYKAVWRLLRDNELYSYVADAMTIEVDEFNEDPRMVKNEVVAYEKSRKSHLRENYYNDDFIQEALKDINAKAKTLISRLSRCENEVDRTEENINFKDEIRKILENKRLSEELFAYYKSGYKLKDCVLLEKALKLDEKSLKELDKETKKEITFIRKVNLEVNTETCITKMYMAYLKDDKKDIKAELETIRYCIYNQIYKEISKGEMDGIGDIEYFSIREIFDIVLKNKNKITENHIKIAVRTLIRNKEKYNKTISEKKAHKVVIKVMEQIYNINEERRITSLRKL